MLRPALVVLFLLSVAADAANSSATGPVELPTESGPGAVPGRRPEVPAEKTGIQSGGAWIRNGGPGDFLGFSSNSAGDVNGDGYSDVIVGSPFHTGSSTQEGKIELFLGTVDGLSTTPAWTRTGGRSHAYLGYSAAGAGDVNGDGFDDVIVGAPGYTSSTASEGRAYLYLGSPSGLEPTHNWSVLSGWTGAHFGRSVAGAGDVNGDGYDDVIVGAPYLGGGFLLTGQGAAYVYLGSTNGLSTSHNVWILGGQTDARLGESVGTAGDVNGDGYDDVIVGSEEFNAGLVGLDNGRAQVFHGSATGVDGNPDWTMIGDAPGYRFGSSVNTAGDVNGDGYSDVIVGCREWVLGGDSVGRAYVYWGSASGVNTWAAWVANGSEADEQLGWTVAPAGDVNADGYADVLVGAAFYDGIGHGRGRMEVYLGSAFGLEWSKAWSRSGLKDNSVYGWGLGAAGDVNGDGFGDILIGAPQYDTGSGQDNSGRVELYYGEPEHLDDVAARTQDGDDTQIYYGFPSLPAGDVNGDGYDDVIVAAQQDNTAGPDAGRVLVYHGSAAGLDMTNPDWSATGEADGDVFGGDICGAGDVNGDGYADILIAAIYVGDNAGKIYCYEGSATGLSAQPAWTMLGEYPDDFLHRVAAAGDVNGDGFADILLAATGWDGVHTDQGKAYLYYGSANGLESTPAWTKEGFDLVDFLGEIATAGDVNGDGYSDILLGIGNHTETVLGEGGVWCHYGSPTGPSITADWSYFSGELGAHMKQVSTAGDVNGDGYADIIVGSRYKTNQWYGDGTAWIFHGSATGLSPTPAVELGLWDTQSFFGRSVGHAGDVNGDGFSDVLVGASMVSNGESQEGAAYLYLGSEDGVWAFPDWAAEGDQIEAWFGRTVHTAGDVNGDGFSDVLINASGYDGAYTDGGRAYLYMGNAGVYLDPAISLGGHQRQADGDPLPVLGHTDTIDQVALHLRGRSPLGRDQVALQWQIAPLGTPLESTPIQTGTFQDSGPVDATLGSAVDLVQVVSGLQPETAYHWRMRVRSDSVHFPWSKWISPGTSIPSLAHFSTGADVTTSVGTATMTMGLKLESVYPNPFNPQTTVSFSLVHQAEVRLQIYDIRGRRVRTLLDGRLDAGVHQAVWDGTDRAGRGVASGTYFARLLGPSSVQTAKMTLVK